MSYIAYPMSAYVLRSILNVLFLFISSLLLANHWNNPIPQQQTTIDIELSLTTSNSTPNQYSTYSVTTTVTNNGFVTATEVVVEIPINLIDDIVYSGGNEFTTSQGVFYPYGTEIWEVGALAAGASATLTTHYFVLGENPYTIYSQVLNANGDELDSTPNNGTPPTPNEDDEAAIAFGLSPNLPDLTVSNLMETLPTELIVDETYPVSFDLNNIGNSLAAGDFRIGIYLSLNQNFDDTDFLVGEVNTGNIVNTITVNSLLKVTDNIFPQFNYYLIIVADDLDNILESKEENNILVSTERFDVTNPNVPCEGILEINTQAEMDAFNPDCTTWQGSIFIGGTVSDLSPLQQLERVIEGSMSIRGTALVNINLPNLQSVEGSFVIEQNEDLLQIGLPVFSSVSLLGMYINAKLMNIDFGNELNSIRSMQIISNESLTNIEDFPIITDTQMEDLTIANNRSLVDVSPLARISGSFPAFSILIDTNPSISSLDGLENVEALNRIAVLNNENLTDACAIYDLLNNGNYNIANIENNQNGSNSIQEILDICAPSGCSISATILDIQCQHNGTLDDATDDTFSASILVEGNNDCTGTFLIDGNAAGFFGNMFICNRKATVGYFPIANGDVNILITDSAGENAVSLTIEAPMTCSEGINTDECGFEQNYDGIPEFFNGGITGTKETANGYELSFFGNSFDNGGSFTHYDLSIDQTGEQTVLTNIPLPAGTFRKAEDGNFYKTTNIGNTELEIAKVNETGLVLWSNVFTFDTGGPQGNGVLYDVLEMPNEIAFLVAALGATNKAWVLRTDNMGNEISLDDILTDTDGYNDFNFVAATNNGDLLYFRQGSGRVGSLGRVATTGELLFEVSIVGDLVSNRIGGFEETPDGNFIYASYLREPTPVLEKLDAFTGACIWVVNLTEVFSPMSDFSFAREGDVTATSDGGAVVGYPFSDISGSQDSGYEYGRVNAAGNLMWWHRILDAYDLDAQLRTSDGGFLFSGIINDEFGIVKMTSEGLFTPICTNIGSSGPDIELAINSIDQGGIYEDASFTITLRNTGNEEATDLSVEILQPNGVVLQGGNEFSVSAGEVSGFGDLTWRLPNLAADEMASLTVNYFTLTANPITSYAQVVSMTEIDSDSTPNNGTPPVPNEDDEAAFTLSGNRMVMPSIDESPRLGKFENDFYLYPNPVASILNIELESAETTNGELMILNLQGQLLETRQLGLERGLNRECIAVENLVSGVYVLRLRMEGREVVERFVKQQ